MGTSRLRVGVDARLVQYRPGGIGTYTLGLLRGLSEVIESNEKIVVLQSHHDKIQGDSLVGCLSSNEISRLPRQLGLRTSRLFTPPHHRLEQLGLAVELTPRRFDVVHWPDFIPPFHRRCRAVITVHDLAFLYYPQLVTGDSLRYYGQIDRAVESADAIIAVSENTKKDLVEHVGARPEKVEVILEAADELYRPLDRAVVGVELKTRFGLDCGYLLFVGTIEPRKNLTFLLRAYAELRARWRAAGRVVLKLVIAGQKGWKYDDVFQAVEELKLAGDVIFLGAVTPADLLALYNGARALVFPSLYEGFGLPPLEAMACGTPVVGTNVSSIPEVIGDAGLLFDPGDEQALIDSLERLILDDALVESLRSRGRARAQSFSWAATAQQTLALYRRVASE